MNREEPFELPLTVRGYEMDAFGHVNNAVYVQYFEHCRWMAFQQLGGDWLGAAPGIVVRKLTVEYDAAARVFDDLVVRLWVESIGTTSVTFGQDLRDADSDERVAAAEVVTVCVDAAGKPQPVPDKWKEAFGFED